MMNPQHAVAPLVLDCPEKAFLFFDLFFEDIRDNLHAWEGKGSNFRHKENGLRKPLERHWSQSAIEGLSLDVMDFGELRFVMSYVLRDAKVYFYEDKPGEKAPGRSHRKKKVSKTVKAEGSLLASAGHKKLKAFVDLANHNWVPEMENLRLGCVVGLVGQLFEHLCILVPQNISGGFELEYATLRRESMDTKVEHHEKIRLASVPSPEAILEIIRRDSHANVGRIIHVFDENLASYLNGVGETVIPNRFQWTLRELLKYEYFSWFISVDDNLSEVTTSLRTGYTKTGHYFRPKKFGDVSFRTQQYGAAILASYFDRYGEDVRMEWHELSREVHAERIASLKRSVYEPTRNALKKLYNMLDEVFQFAMSTPHQPGNLLIGYRLKMTYKRLFELAHVDRERGDTSINLFSVALMSGCAETAYDTWQTRFRSEMQQRDFEKFYRTVQEARVLLQS